MLTYQVRKRSFKLIDGESFEFPNQVEILFTFQPLQPFGKSAGGGRTAIRAVEAEMYSNTNTGHFTIESKRPLKPLEVSILEEGFGSIALTGNCLQINTRCESIIHLKHLTESIFFLIPMLLNIEFADPPVIEDVTGRVGKTNFRWALSEWKNEIETTTQKKQETRIVSSWERYKLIIQPENRRFVAAIHYFHVACRLNRSGHSPWEFMSEIILNLSKVLEVLFPPLEAGKTRDGVRESLKKIGYSDNEIERYFIPIMALRNNIDVGHVHLSLLTQEQLQVLHVYTESLESAIRSMLRILIDKIQKSEFRLDRNFNLSLNKEIAKIIEKLQTMNSK
jgi:hypothetical protein